MGISLPFSVSCISKSFPVKTLKIKNGKNFQRFYTLVVVTVKITIFWDVTPCSPVEMQQCFRGTCCLKDGSGRSLHSITSQKTIITNNNFFSRYVVFCVPYQDSSIIPIVIHLHQLPGWFALLLQVAFLISQLCQYAEPSSHCQK
jgi:hypothetical protein